jgi:two-component system cell cycle response regulator DivK
MYTQWHALIIDDDMASNKVLANLLAREDVGSTIVQDLLQLEATIQTLEACDIVFLDLEMPVLDGYQVFQKLSADSRFASVPIVACTVHTSEAANARRMGIHGFIAKPLDPQRFPEQLRRILNGEQVWESR